MADEQAEGLRKIARRCDVKDHAEQETCAAGRCEQDLLAAIIIAVTPCGVLFPSDRAHACCCDRLENCSFGHIAGHVSDGHPAIQDIEGQAVRTSDGRSNSLLKNRDLLGTVHSTYLEGATAMK